MELTILERLLLLQVIPLGAPQKGGLMKMRIVDDLNDDIGIPEKEMQLINFKFHENGNITWDDGLTPKDVEIGPFGMEIICKGLSLALPEWDAQEEFTMGHISLYKKFNVDMTLPEPEPEQENEEKIK